MAHISEILVAVNVVYDSAGERGEHNDHGRPRAERCKNDNERDHAYDRAYNVKGCGKNAYRAHSRFSVSVFKLFIKLGAVKGAGVNRLSLLYDLELDMINDELTRDGGNACVESVEYSLDEKIYKFKKQKEEAEHTLSLILLTKDILKDAKEDLSTRYLRDMEMHFDRYYQKITKEPSAELPADGSRVSHFSMDTSLAISCETYGERRPVSVLSRGERDLVAFCARLSLLESIFTKETPVLLLDDPFINLDDEKISAAMKLLAKISEERQILYLSCHSSLT